MTTITSASDNPITLNISTTGSPGSAGQNGADGQGFAQVRYSVLNNPLCRILKRREPVSVLESNISFTRNTQASYIDLYGDLFFADNDDLRENNFGYRFDGQSENLFLNSLSPVNQDVTLASNDYTLTVLGAGTVSTTSGNATEGIPLTFNDSGLVTFQVSGSVDAVQLESGLKSTSIIKTLSSTAVRSADELTFNTVNNLPDLTKQWSLIFYIDSDYDDFCVIDSTQIRISKDTNGFWSVNGNTSSATGGKTIAVTHNGTATKIYTDGLLSDTLVIGYSNLSTGFARVGARIDGTRSLFGSLLDVQFFNVELNEQEIKLMKGIL